MSGGKKISGRDDARTFTSLLNCSSVITIGPIARIGGEAK